MSVLSPTLLPVVASHCELMLSKLPSLTVSVLPNCASGCPIPRESFVALVKEAIEAAIEIHEISGTEKCQYYREDARVFVVEEVTPDVTSIWNYRHIAGEMGGLNKRKRKYIRRIHMLVDSPEGLYGAAKLDHNVHYQLMLNELEAFFDDMSSQGISLYDARRHDAPDHNADEVCALMYFPDKSFGKEGSNFFSLAGRDVVDPIFKRLVKSVDPEKIFRYMMSEVESDDFTTGRGNLCLDYGYCAENSTDVSQEDLLSYPSPKLNTCHDDKAGWKSARRSSDMKEVMAGLTKLMDFGTTRLGLVKKFDDSERNSHFANKIHRDNRGEKLTMSLTELVLAHLDSLNDYEDSYEWNISYYGYFYDRKRKECRRMHLGIYSRRVCATLNERVANTNGLANDIIDFLDTLSPAQLEYSAESIFKLYGEEKPDENGLIFRSVHMNKFLF